VAKHSTFKVKGWLDAGCDWFAILTIFQGLSTRNPRFTAAAKSRLTFGGAFEFTIRSIMLLLTSIRRSAGLIST
jgi:hypothetical protein